MKTKLHFEFEVECGDVEQTMLDEAPQLYEIALHHMLDLGFQRKISGLQISKVIRVAPSQSKPNELFGISEQLPEWIDATKGAPPETADILVHIPAEYGTPAHYEIAHLFGTQWYSQNGELITPDYWMQIPPINTENR